MTPGIYALVSLAGSPFDAADLAALGIDATKTPAEVVQCEGLALRVYDPQPGAISVERTADSLTVFTGFLDEPAELAALLGCASATPAIRLAVTALERFGADAAYHALGTWTLLRWHARCRELTVLSSQMLRDNLYVASGHGLVAIAPRCLTLGDLSWVGRALEPHAFALSLSRAGLRHIRTDQTMWQGIRLLPAGTCSVFTAGGRTTTRMRTPSTRTRFTGSFDEAVAEFDRVGRRVVRQQMERHGLCAFQLSGGLDSTLLTAWGALERGPGREMFAVTSVAPPGSGLADEQEFSVPAAEMLGVPLRKAWTLPEESLFRPDARRFQLVESAVSSAYLTTEALELLAFAGGATAVISGHAGEMHVSRGSKVTETRGALRQWGARLRDRMVARRERGGWPASAFHVSLSPELLRSLPAEWASVWRKGPATGEPRLPSGTLGISPMADKHANAGSAHPEGHLRRLGPYFDQRLQRLAAGMPASFQMHQGETRALARALLKGRMPEAVRLRTQGRPFAPDYVQRARAQASAAKARIPIFAEAGVGHWIDLSALSCGLTQITQSGGASDYKLYYQVQGTAVMAEFLLWLSSERVSLSIFGKD